MKTQAEKLLGGFGGGAEFKAFDIIDESIPLFKRKMVFEYGESTKLGRIQVENRVRPFTISLQKSQSMNTRKVQLKVSNDKKFSSTSLLEELIIEDSPNSQVYQKIQINFAPEYTKQLYFEFEILDYEFVEQQRDCQDDKHCEGGDHINVVVGFGQGNFNAFIRKKAAKALVKVMEARKGRLERLREANKSKVYESSSASEYEDSDAEVDGQRKKKDKHQEPHDHK